MEVDSVYIGYEYQGANATVLLCGTFDVLQGSCIGPLTLKNYKPKLYWSLNAWQTSVTFAICCIRY